MHKVGDYVVYKNNGICVIEDIRKEKFGFQEKQDYYVLKLLYIDDARIYIPLQKEETEQKMRPPVSKQTAENIIAEYANAVEFWIYDDKLRAAKFRDILDGADLEKLAVLVKSLSKKNAELVSAGKRLRVSDDSVYRKAESNFCGELAYVLSKSPSEIKQLLN